MSKLTAYQLACGAVQRVKRGADYVDMYREHNMYHVRRFSDSVGGRRVQEFWGCFERVVDARRAFKRQVELAEVENV